ncbi:MAG: patatin-like phospholipase family protein [Taibaiella sp.]|nr:patatin-like phospholipase family protein [Taibaiella sp.]
MRNTNTTYRHSMEAVQISMTLPIAFKPVYVDTPVRRDDTMQNTKYQGLFIDGGMLNNYPIHAFDHIEYTENPTPGATFLSGITYRGLRGDYPIAGDPKLRQADCNCVLGMRLQDKEEKPERFEKKDFYPSDKMVLGSFLGDLLFTYMAYSEEGQIRSKSDEERTVEFYATVKEDFEGFAELKYKLKLDKDAKEYSLSVLDFSSPAIDRTSERRHEFLAKVKEKLMDDASKKMTEFLKKQ